MKLETPRIFFNGEYIDNPKFDAEAWKNASDKEREQAVKETANERPKESAD